VSLPALAHRKLTFSAWMGDSARDAAIQYDFHVLRRFLRTQTNFLNPCWYDRLHEANWT
jgi:hypothetical protein